MKKLLLLLLVLFQVSFALAQNFPVRVTPQAIPPYPTNLSGYANSGLVNSPLRVQLVLSDVTASSREVRLGVSIEGNGINATSAPVIIGAPTLILDGGIPLNLTIAELAPYFEQQNLQGLSAVQYNSSLPDGTYRFCFEVFDAFNGNRLSTKNCATVFLINNDPPFLNKPDNESKITEQNPTNIIFQWTPRHVNVPNVSYEFSIVEVWDPYIDPQAIFVSSPPLYQEVTTNTSLLYGPIQPLLLAGKRYAWRVRAFATNNGEEVSVFNNNGNSEIFWFDYQGNCELPTNIQVQDVSLTNATISWIGHPEHLDYTIEYREAGSDRWYKKTTPRDYVTIDEFKPDTVYEYRVIGNCAEGSFGESPVDTFRTLSEELAEYTSCGIEPDPVDLSNQELLTELFVNDVFTAGDFPVYVKEVSGSGSFTGEGYISTPWLATVRIPVKFQNIKINTDMKLVDGFVVTTYDPNWGSIVDADDIIEIVTGDDGDVDVINVDVDIVDIEVNDDGTITIITSDGGEIDQPGGEDVVYIDNTGETWSVSEDGTVTQGEEAEGGPANSGNTDGVGSGGVNEITSTDVKVEFTKGNGFYSFDEFPQNAGGNIANQYDKVPITGGGEYYIPYKAVSNLEGHLSDVLQANATFTNSEYTKDDIIFKTKEGIKVQANWNGNTATLSVKKAFDFGKQEIIATIKPKDTTQNYSVAGSAKLWHLASQEVTDVNVTIIPVNNVSVPNNIGQQINAIYNPAGVNFNVTVGNRLTIADNIWDLNGNGQLDIGDSSLLEQYTDEERAINSYFKSQTNYNNKTYYIFVTDLTTTDAGTTGFMPLKRQYGFIFDQNNQARTIAHELGHGVFGLEHPFTEYNTTGTTNLLMDYGTGTVLNHMDWEKMHAPGIQIYWFQGDEDGEHYITRGYFREKEFGENNDDKKTFTFLTPSAQYLVLPNDVQDITKFYGYYGNSFLDNELQFKEFMNVVPGTLKSFKIGDKTFEAKIIKSGDKFVLKGYYDGSNQYDLSSYGIQIVEENKQKAIIFAVEKNDNTIGYNAIQLKASEFSLFAENSDIKSPIDFPYQHDWVEKKKSFDVASIGTQFSYNGEEVKWTFGIDENNYSTTDNTLLIRNKILEFKTAYPRFLEEYTGDQDNLPISWTICSDYYIPKTNEVNNFEDDLRDNYCNCESHPYQQTGPGQPTAWVECNKRNQIQEPTNKKEWLTLLYSYLKESAINVNESISNAIIDYNTFPEKIQTDSSSEIAYIVNIASQNDIGQLGAETILRIISKFVNETFTQESSSAKYDLEGAIIKLVQFANKNINKSLLTGIEGNNKYDSDKVLSEQVFYAVDDSFLFFGSDNRSILIQEFTKKIFDTPELYDQRLAEAVNDIENRSFVFEYTNVVGRALVEIGNIASEATTYGFLEAPLSDYYQTETINKEFITDQNDSNFGKIKLTQLTQSGFRDIEYNNEDNYLPFDLIFFTNKSNLTSAKVFESGLGFDPKIYPIPAIAVAYVSQAGENQTTADGIFTVIDIASLAVSGGALNIATNLTRAKRIFYTADVISSMASIGAISVSDHSELNELKKVLDITSAISGIISLGDNISNIKFKNILVKAKNNVDKAEQIAVDIRKLSENINDMTDSQLRVFVKDYENVTDSYLGYAMKDLQDAKHANDIEAIQKIKLAVSKVLNARLNLGGSNPMIVLGTDLQKTIDRLKFLENKNGDGIIDLVIHGANKKLIVDGAEVTDISNIKNWLITNHPDKKTVRLLSCTNLDGAQDFVNALGDGYKVHATDGFIRIHNDGAISNVPREIDGDMKWYELSKDANKVELPENARPRGPDANPELEYLDDFLELSNRAIDEINWATIKRLNPTLAQKITDKFSDVSEKSEFVADLLHKKGFDKPKILQRDLLFKSLDKITDKHIDAWKKLQAYSKIRKSFDNLEGFSNILERFNSLTKSDQDDFLKVISTNEVKSSGGKPFGAVNLNELMVNNIKNLEEEHIDVWLELKKHADEVNSQYNFKSIDDISLGVNTIENVVIQYGKRGVNLHTLLSKFGFDKCAEAVSKAGGVNARNIDKLKKGIIDEVFGGIEETKNAYTFTINGNTYQVNGNDWGRFFQDLKASPDFNEFQSHHVLVIDLFKSSGFRKWYETKGVNNLDINGENTLGNLIMLEQFAYSKGVHAQHNAYNEALKNVINDRWAEHLDLLGNESSAIEKLDNDIKKLQKGIKQLLVEKSVIGSVDNSGNWVRTKVNDLITPDLLKTMLNN